MSSYGEIIHHDDVIIDLGAVADEDLFSLQEEIEHRQNTPNFYTFAHTRDDDKEALGFIADEIYWRFRTGSSLDEDLDGAYRCALGCCD